MDIADVQSTSAAASSSSTEHGVVHPGHEWSCACEQGIQLLGLQQEHSGAEIQGYTGSISLIAFDDMISNQRTVSWVHWTQPGTEGRLADLDSENNLKVIVPVGTRRTPVNFEHRNMTMIWQDTGVRNVRAQWKKTNIKIKCVIIW